METLNPASFFGNPNCNWLSAEKTSKICKWTKEENKRFESALALFDEKTPDRWNRVAAMLPGKSVPQVIAQYEVLVADVSSIEAGLVPVPLLPGGPGGGPYPPSFSFDLSENHAYESCRKRATRSCDQERKKGIPWTEEEHRRFLMGLQAHGKGDWRNISRNFVITKTPTQVASHAQKYFLRQISGGKDKKRPSIHDITTVNLIRGKPLSDDDPHQCKSPSSQSLNNPPPKGFLFGWNEFDSESAADDGFSMVFESNQCNNESMSSLFGIAGTNNSNNNYAPNLCAAANSKFCFPSAKYVHG